MDYFLKNIAAKILSAHRSSLREVAIVLPNRRAGLFLKQHLYEQAQQPLFSPAILGIQDFISLHTDLLIREPIRLLPELYRLHCQIEGAKASPFKDFFHLGEKMIRDFSDIDLYLADAKTIFSWLNEEKAMALWSPNGDPLTDFQKEYLLFFNRLEDYYTLFKQNLLQKKQTYEGLAYRRMAEQIEQFNFPYSSIWFCGFNALSKAEYKIFKILEERGLALLEWDSDPYYMDNTVQEAGKFLRTYKKEFRHFQRGEEHFKKPKKITLLGTGENLLQVKVAGELLAKQKTDPSGQQSSCLILADESLLIPTLNSIPSTIKDLNITMGYPFHLSPIHLLIRQLFKLHLQREKMAQGKLYTPELEQILRSDLLLVATDTAYHAYIKEKLDSLGKTYLTENEFEWVCRSLFIDYDLLKPLFINFSTLDEFLNLLKQIGTLVDLQRGSKKFLDEYRLALEEIILCFEEIENTDKALDSVQSLYPLYLRFAQKVKVPFYGEPIKGLQLMGLLETRCLDFDKVILLSANEGILPSGKQTETLIPMQIKNHFGIPTSLEKDAIYAYHFYHLLQRAQEIHLIYHTDSNGVDKGEKSRFVKQILYELPIYSSEVEIKELLYNSTTLESGEGNLISIKKTEKILQQIKKRALFPGFSPSALNTFNRCSLQFYFLYVLRIKEEKTQLEGLTADILGTASHKVLEVLFQKSVDSKRNIDASQLASFTPEIEKRFVEEVKKLYNHEIEFGKNKLLLSVSIEQLNHFIQCQILLLQKHNIRLLEQEKRLEHTLFRKEGGSSIPIKLVGVVDRIEQEGDEIRIIDYKTGKISPSDVLMKRENIEKAPKEKWFQLMMYAWLLSKQKNYSPPFVSGIYGLRQRESTLLSCKLDNQECIDEASLSFFEDYLQTLIDTLLDASVEFSQCSKSESCSYCQFAALCGR